MRGSMKVLALVLVAAAFVAVPVLAQGLGPHGRGHGGHGGPGGPDFLAHMTKELGLSADQQTQIKAILSKYHQGSLGEKMQGMHEARGTLGETIHDPDATDQQVQDAATAIAALEAQLAVEQHHMVLEMSAVLTADQRTKLAQLKQAHKDRGDGPPPPPDGGF